MFGIISGRRDRGTVSRAPLASARTATILLCTLNGERFLAAQLASLERKTFKNWKLIASDDGSSDRTISILQAIRTSLEPGKVEIIDGPRRGAPANFLWPAERISSANTTPFATRMTFGRRTNWLAQSTSWNRQAPLFRRSTAPARA